MIVDPVVQIGWNIDTRWVHEHYVVAQQTALFAGPENSNFGTFAKLVSAQGIGQLLNVLYTKQLLVHIAIQLQITNAQ